MRHGTKTINASYVGSKREESTEDMAMILSQSGTINRSRGLRSRGRYGRGRRKFNFEHTE